MAKTYAVKGRAVSGKAVTKNLQAEGTALHEKRETPRERKAEGESTKRDTEGGAKGGSITKKLIQTGRATDAQ